MNPRALWKPFLLYSCLLSLLTVGAAYLVTDSGFGMLFSAGIGLTLAVLSVGTTGPAGVGAGEYGGDAEMVVEDAGVWPTPRDTSSSLIFLCYGVGVFLWSLLVLYTLYDVIG